MMTQGLYAHRATSVRGLDAAALTVALILSACSNQTSEKARPPFADSADEPGVSSVAHAAVQVFGKAPITRSGIPAVIIMEPTHSLQFPGPTHIPAMDQIARTFVPPMLFVRTGHQAEFRNSDHEMHNVNVTDASTRQQEFNVAVPDGERYVHTFEHSGIYDVSCDIHAGMWAQIVATSSPYATVADAQGNFVFPDVVPGEYAVAIYAGQQTIHKTINVTGTEAIIDMTPSGQGTR